jgi:hypothetical protein
MLNDPRTCDAGGLRHTLAIGQFLTGSLVACDRIHRLLIV